MSYTRDDVAAAVESLGPAYKIYAMKVIEQDIDGPCIFNLFESLNLDDPRGWDFKEFDRLMERGLQVPFSGHRMRIKSLFHDIYMQERAVRDFRMRLEKFRDSMPPLLAAAAAFAVVGRCRAPAHFLQRPAALGTMLSQRSAGLVSLHHKLHLCKERLQLLCCGSPLSALLLRLAAVVDRSGRSSAEHMHVVYIMKRYFSGVARRLWNKCMQ